MTATRRTEVVRVGTALLIAVLVLVFELWGTHHSHSLPLALDAGHVAADLAALTASFIIALILWHGRLSHAQEARIERRGTYLNAYLLLLVVVLISAVSIWRLFNLKAVASETAFWVALVGLIGNLLQRWVLSRCPCIRHRSIRLHVDSDMKTSIAVIVAAPAVNFTGWQWLDPAAALLIAGYISKTVYELFSGLKNGESGHHH